MTMMNSSQQFLANHSVECSREPNDPYKGLVGVVGVFSPALRKACYMFSSWNVLS